MIPALLVALLVTLGGTVASYAYDNDAPLVVRCAYGVATGLVAFALIGFMLANFVPIGLATVVAALVAAAPLVALTRPTARARVGADLRSARGEVAVAARRPSLDTAGPLVYVVVLAVFLWLVFDRVILETDGGLSTGFVNNLGDLPFHLQVTSSFAFGQNFPPEDPTYAGTGFAYPYLADFVAATFVTLGASLKDAFFLQNLLLALSLAAVIHRFTRVLTGDRVAAYIAPVLLFLSGGLGFLAFLDDARNNGIGVLGTLAALPHDYTIVADGPYRFGNAITTLLVTQRSLLFGLPIAVIVFMLLWQLVHADPPAAGRPTPPDRPIRLALAGGILTGSLPLVHAHSFVVVFGTAFFVGVLFRQWRERRWVPWAIYVIAALALSLPQIWWSTHDSIANAGTFFGFEFGWDHGQANVVWFWIMNAGPFVALSAIAALWPGERPLASRALLLFSAVFLVWFIVPNAMKLAPWVWDNIKVLFYWYVGLIPLVALLLARWFRQGTGWRTAAAAGILVMTLSGGIDIWRVLSGQTQYQEFDRDGISVASFIRDETPARALILHAPTYNPAVFLTGRRSLLGYTGYIWAHGLPYVDREADIKRIYAGEPGAAELIDRYAIDYILVSPIERGSLTVNDAFLSQYPIIDQLGAYDLHEVPRP